MAHISGLLLIDAPAAALNNAQGESGTVVANRIPVKQIRTRAGAYPYVSAQAFRYWLRSTLQAGATQSGWASSPVLREEKIAYTDANPIRWWDDDLLGYMRAPGKSKTARESRGEAAETPVAQTVTRSSPFRTSTLIAIAPANPTDDFGVMARQEGDPVPHEHQFYHTTLQGLFSLDLQAAGTFWTSSRSGYQNLDGVRREAAASAGLTEVSIAGGQAYRLPLAERVTRITTLLGALPQISGGAKRALHYTDVAPSLLVMAVSRGGNHLFPHLVAADRSGTPVFQVPTLAETAAIFQDELLSPIYIGWPRGYLEEQRAEVLAAVAGLPVEVGHPREAVRRLCVALQENAAAWLA